MAFVFLTKKNNYFYYPHFTENLCAKQKKKKGSYQFIYNPIFAYSLLMQLKPTHIDKVQLVQHVKLKSGRTSCPEAALIIYPMNSFKSFLIRDFPGGPVVKTLPSNSGGAGSIPGQGAKIPHASQTKSKAESRSNIVTNSIKTF